MLQHLAIIMDWNRRWAKAKFLPALAWHKAGADNVKTILELAAKKDIKYLTVWALSTENLQKRSESEVKGIISLIDNIELYLWDALENNVVFRTIWDISKLPEKSQLVLNTVIEKTKSNSWITLTVALIYGWQDEIVRATKKIITQNKNPEDLTTDEFRSYLDTSFLPVPDVIVRTGWDVRHSGFMLYDSAYSEYYFTDKWWPDYDEQELDKTIDFFNKSKRNFGK